LVVHLSLLHVIVIKTKSPFWKEIMHSQNHLLYLQLISMPFNYRYLFFHTHSFTSTAIGMWLHTTMVNYTLFAGELATRNKGSEHEIEAIEIDGMVDACVVQKVGIIHFIGCRKKLTIVAIVASSVFLFHINHKAILHITLVL